MKQEIKDLQKSPAAEKMYPITSDWVPTVDVLAIINRFEKHWKHYVEDHKNADEKKLIDQMLGEG
jgi:hypothetical protein